MGDGDFFDDMWRGLAGFASHTSDDDVRCYVKECTNFLDFEWAYVFNYATEVDQSLWPAGEVDAASFKQQFESMVYRPKESDVDLDAWAALADLVGPVVPQRISEGLCFTIHLPFDNTAGMVDNSTALGPIVPLFFLLGCEDRRVRVDTCGWLHQHQSLPTESQPIQGDSSELKCQMYLH